MLAQIAGDPNAVDVAIIGAISLVAVGILTTIQTWISHRQAKGTNARLGDPNGRGNVVEMLHTIIDTQNRQVDREAHQDERVAKLEERSLQSFESIAKLEGRLEAIEKKVI